MKKRVILVAWLLGLAAIAWTCSGRPGTTRSGMTHGADTVDGSSARNGIEAPTMKGTA
jgi:hypothetical protein